MGNRAVVIFSDDKFENFSPAVYLHWNGGPESVYQFLDELDRRDVRADQDYECARFIQIVGEFMDQDYRTGLSLGVWNGPKDIREASGMSGGDNGVYVVARSDGKRTVRRFLGFDNSKEMEPEFVAAEERSAHKHKYWQDGGFRSVWGQKPTEACRATA